VNELTRAGQAKVQNQNLYFWNHPIESPGDDGWVSPKFENPNQITLKTAEGYSRDSERIIFDRTHPASPPSLQLLFE
jgi:hypothetical protein